MVLPSHSCGGTLQSLHLKLLHSSTQTSADRKSGQSQLSRMTDEKGETWSPFGMSKVRSRPESMVADTRVYGGRLFDAHATTGKVRLPRVARRVDGTWSVMVSAEQRLWCWPQAVGQVCRCCAMHTMVRQNTQPELYSLRDAQPVKLP